MKRHSALIRSMGLTRSPLAPASQKVLSTREKRNETRLAVHQRARGECEARLEGCTGAGTEVHEIQTRARGGSITDPENCLLLCHSCHRHVTDHPGFALERGLVVHSWASDADIAHARLLREANRRRWVVR